MITSTDLWIAYMAGFAGGLILPVLGLMLHLWREQRAEQIKRRHWRSIMKFRP